ncbi:MAG: GTPase RsgA, partial [candidate division KSB1 bacterium]|nr:GTPase RsgA [candidate division KSB1 bacterium]
MQLKELGYDQWFADQIEQHHIADVSPARVAAVDKNSYLVRGEIGEAQAELSGKMMFDTQSTLDFPAVGDWVAVQYYNDDTFAIVHDVLKRKTLLSRKTSGKQISHQLIAANIDVALIMQSVDANFNLRRLERYLVMAQEGGIEPVIALSKTDLISESELREKMEQTRQFNEKYKILAFSSVVERGVQTVQEMIEPGKTYCLLGSSGVGKTTLLNSLLGRDA